MSSAFFIITCLQKCLANAFVIRSDSTARLLRVQSQQLPTESQVFEDEVLAGAKSAYHPAEEMSERHDHGKNLTGKLRIELCAKSFILQVYEVLARHRPRNDRRSLIDCKMPVWKRVIKAEVELRCTLVRRTFRNIEG
jgi:hypothetical protein